MDRPRTTDHFAEFERCHRNDPAGGGRCKDSGKYGRFGIFRTGDVKGQDFKLDIAWLKYGSRGNPEIRASHYRQPSLFY